jgi:hypothetical protein
VRLIQGPPGTGKTRTLTAALALLAEGSGRTLVCAPSNKALHELAARFLTVASGAPPVALLGVEGKGALAGPGGDTAPTAAALLLRSAHTTEWLGWRSGQLRRAAEELATAGGEPAAEAAAHGRVAAVLAELRDRCPAHFEAKLAPRCRALGARPTVAQLQELVREVGGGAADAVRHRASPRRLPSKRERSIGHSRCQHQPPGARRWSGRCWGRRG